MGTIETISVENEHMPPFFAKIPVSIDRGEGVYVWDEEGNRYLDLTAGWGVTCIGHAQPAIQSAMTEQASRILQNPNSPRSAKAKIIHDRGFCPFPLGPSWTVAFRTGDACASRS
jgi:acetylornithine/succinyldiaminopimelate/putrescine aminotransferase